jgi:tetratricopeptide (TPR) repeat protein
MSPLKTLVFSLALALSAGAASAASAPGADAQDETAEATPVLFVAGRARASDAWPRTWPLVVSAARPVAAGQNLELRVLRGGQPQGWPWARAALGDVALPTWLLSAERLAQQPAADYVLELRSGERTLGETALRLTESIPATAEAAHQALLARISHAAAAADAVAMLGAATELLGRHPRDSAAHALMGDALALGGDDSGALQAYQRAIAFWGASIDPPAHLLERYNEIQARLLRLAPTRAAAPLGGPELRFHKSVREGDVALAKGDAAGAVRAYERALGQHKSGKLVLDAGYVEARLAEARRRADEAKTTKGDGK